MVPDGESELRAYYERLVGGGLATWQDAVDSATAKGHQSLAREFAARARGGAAPAAPKSRRAAAADETA